jgi:tetratricopeptide (TPR) repeat protein
MVELQDTSSAHPAMRASVYPNGEFEVRGVREGTYFLRVVSMRGEMITNQVVSIAGYRNFVSVRLPERTSPERPVQGLISVARLQHEPAKQALKEFKKAAEAAKDGENEKAVGHLQKAIEIDPEYIEAYNNLGTRYVIAGQLEKAVAAFRKGLALDPSAAMIESNLAIALINLKEFAGAEEAARRSVDLNGTDVKGRYVLGIALYAQGKYTPEAVEQLRRAEERFPNAGLALAAILATTGKIDQARHKLEAYLEAGHTDKREQARQMLVTLKKQTH